MVLGFTIMLDRLMYGSWVLVPLNFLRFNFLSSGGDYYGTHVWHWYISQGFTVMIFTFLPFSILGITIAKHWKLSGLVPWVLGLYSVLGHKEFRCLISFSRTILTKAQVAICISCSSISTYLESESWNRFVLPVLPIALIFSGVCLASLSNASHLRNKSKQSSKSYVRCPAKKRWAVGFLLVTNIPVALYMSLVHQV